MHQASTECTRALGSAAVVRSMTTTSGMSKRLTPNKSMPHRVNKSFTFWRFRDYLTVDRIVPALAVRRLTSGCAFWGRQNHHDCNKVCPQNHHEGAASKQGGAS
jgi:hypothetical protein